VNKEIIFMLRNSPIRI